MISWIAIAVLVLYLVYFLVTRSKSKPIPSTIKITRKRFPLEKDDIVPFKSEAIILGTFYEKDEKFASICPYIANRILPIPHVVWVRDDNSLAWGEGEINIVIQEKAARIYKEYKKNHKDRFY